MKKITVNTLLAIFAFCVAVGCEKKPETAPPVELALSKQLARMNEISPIDKIKITSGNGGYFIVFPKQIYVGGEEGGDVDYSQDILHLHIDEDDNIVVECKLLTDQIISGLFLVEDIKGQRRLFAADYPDIVGNVYDFEWLEATYLNDPDYWQR